jgi:hypothetical protein
MLFHFKLTDGSIAEDIEGLELSDLDARRARRWIGPRSSDGVGGRCKGERLLVRAIIQGGRRQ